MEGEWQCRSAEEMRSLGREWAAELGKGACLVLSGPLGAGKTEFVRGLAKGLGFPGLVSSPTFALLQEYRGGREVLFHLDLYRIEGERELLDLGWDELLEQGIVVAEWGDRFPDLLPPGFRRLRFSHVGSGGRRVVSEVGTGPGGPG